MTLIVINRLNRILDKIKEHFQNTFYLENYYAAIIRGFLLIKYGNNSRFEIRMNSKMSIIV